jgi:N,N-dimethylformamidase
MVESGWTYDLEFRLPETLTSGVYAVRLEAGGGRNHFPLFVRPPAGAAAPVLFLAPTNTYLAYANDHLASRLARFLLCDASRQGRSGG